MIVLKSSGETSNVVLELLQLASGQTPVYLFELVKKGSTVVNSFISSDISPVPCRYQLFTITNASGDPTNGYISLLGGEYDYTIWQVDSISLSANKLVKLQTGLAFVKGVITNSIYT